ncbi:sugar ABC transporter permease [Paenibacillus sp. MY03]|jgi:putative aldouronate transport system permease protein|uniref:Sugar ABC transporter permease n=1 Tax=Paenibacillus agaridevorans TaxID=171404 RepID=A0A2R5ERB2_9BACL|nr:MULTISPECIES: carbohydrate ABC transporter permease [Paenibacillus]OUS74386.1 sugar ABC transporter permease [Paenibacillus sp. MY03]GBG05931.1 sugar ABC transporter permease [Paenibacillus agaridevorans]
MTIYPNRLIKESPGDRVFNVATHLYLWIIFVLVAYPLIYVVSASFSAPSAVISGKVWLWPVEPTLNGYEAVFKNKQLVSGFANSIFYMVAGTLINLVMTVMAAFPLSRKELSGRNLFMAIFVFTMLFSGGLIPNFLLVRDLGMLDTRWAMLLPVALSVWNVIITRTYFQATIPDELYEAASMDGCNDFRFLLRMALPLSAPILAVIALYYGVGHWNSYFNALIYLKSPDLQPLQIILRNILVLNQLDPTMMQDFEALQRKQGLVDIVKYAVIVVASVPVLLIYPFVQKYFVRGIMIGAIKG